MLAFSGEEYPEPDTAQQLKDRGHDLDLDGPSYLVHLYEDQPAFPSALNGRFHGLVADRNRGTAMLFNDRYGMHGSTITSRRRRSILPRKPKPFWPCVLSSDGSIPEVSESLSLVAPFLRTGHFSKVSMFAAGIGVGFS